MRIYFTAVCGLTLLLGIVSVARATTKGLNQIVTPDIQPAGVLSVSAQVQDSRIGNSQQLQFELGLTRWAEIAVFQGLRPREEIFGAEFGLWQQGPHLLSAGTVNWSSLGGGTQPVLEYGYYVDRDHLIGGVIRADERVEVILGYSRQLTDKLQLAVDYQSGSGNALTFGATINLRPDVQVNPAVYVENTRPHRVLGYVVLTWNLALWH
jgi:hypothetical protein